MSKTAYPTIQTFFKPEVKNPKPPHLTGLPATQPGDAFTSSEIETTIDPLKRDFNPEREYTELEIGNLKAGPLPVSFMGRVVNFTTFVGKGKKKVEGIVGGWHHVVLRDDTGAVSMKLYFVHQPYPLHLGLLVTVWTPFISTIPSNDSFSCSNVLLRTSIFPGRDPLVHIILHEVSDSGTRFHTPLSYDSVTNTLPGLINLQSWLDGGYEVENTKLLVCVKSIGPKKAITTKAGKSLELQEVKIFDETGTSTLKLWNEMITSASRWTPGKTILLLSEAQFRPEWGRGSVGVGGKAMVDVEPECADADWLRKWATRLLTRESVKQDVIEDGMFDLDACERSSQRILFTIADIDEWARDEPHGTFMGFLSVLIMGIDLSLYSRRNMLMCTECCGIPIYNNVPVSECNNCHKSVSLSLTPKIIGDLLDETGVIEAGMAVWTPYAWKCLFGRSPEQLVMMSAEEMGLMEQRMLFMRVTLVFGWNEKVGKLAVLAVRE